MLWELRTLQGQTPDSRKSLIAIGAFATALRRSAAGYYFWWCWALCEVLLSKWDSPASISWGPVGWCHLGMTLNLCLMIVRSLHIWSTWTRIQQIYANMYVTLPGWGPTPSSAPLFSWLQVSSSTWSMGPGLNCGSREHTYNIIWHQLEPGWTAPSWPSLGNPSSQVDILRQLDLKHTMK